MMTASWPRERLFALFGVVAPVLFVLLIAVASIARPGYSQVYNPSSDLGVGPDAIIQNVNFTAFGVLSIGFAYGLRAGLPSPPTRAGNAGVRLVMVFGFGILLAGVFPENYLSGGPHALASITAFLSIVAAQLAIWRGLKVADGAVWGNYRTFSLWSGLLTLVLLSAYSSPLGVEYPGAAQRAFVAAWLVWIEATGWKLSAER